MQTLHRTFSAYFQLCFGKPVIFLYSGLPPRIIQSSIPFPNGALQSPISGINLFSSTRHNNLMVASLTIAFCIISKSLATAIRSIPTLTSHGKISSINRYVPTPGSVITRDCSCSLATIPFFSPSQMITLFFSRAGLTFQIFKP